jgi:hypothetical protein
MPQDLIFEMGTDLNGLDIRMLRCLGKKGKNSPAAVIYGKH